MSYAAIIALLQSALLLLSTAQTTPNLPQNFRDNAISIAQQAIGDATKALAASATSSVATSTKILATVGSTTPAKAPEIEFSFAPASNQNDGFILSWSTKDAQSCTLDSSPVLLAPIGSQKTGLIYVETTHKITCTNGTTSASSSVTTPAAIPPDECFAMNQYDVCTAGTKNGKSFQVINGVTKYY